MNLMTTVYPLKKGWGKSLLLSTLQDKNQLNDASMVRNEVLIILFYSYQDMYRKFMM